MCEGSVGASAGVGRQYAGIPCVVGSYVGDVVEDD
jgi:hypothetical protein